MGGAVWSVLLLIFHLLARLRMREDERVVGERKRERGRRTDNQTQQGGVKATQIKQGSELVESYLGTGHCEGDEDRITSTRRGCDDNCIDEPATSLWPVTVLFSLVEGPKQRIESRVRLTGLVVQSFFTWPTYRVTKCCKALLRGPCCVSQWGTFAPQHVTAMSQL